MPSEFLVFPAKIVVEIRSAFPCPNATLIVILIAYRKIGWEDLREAFGQHSEDHPFPTACIFDELMTSADVEATLSSAIPSVSST